jgi:glycosyltransferase involved in cell wall biosynthesis
VSKKIAVLIPAYNASQTLPELVQRIKKTLPQSSVIVVNDGSQDDSGNLARKAGATVLEHKVNQGKGEALRTGFDYVVQNGFEHVITIDADLQHRPEELRLFTEEVKRGSFDLIVGTRDFSFRNMPFDRVVTNFVSSVILTLLSGQTIKDSQSGYRLISCKILREIKLKCRKYDLESEILIKAGRKGFKIGEVPITTVYEGSKSFINPLIDTGRFIRICWKCLFW